MVISQVCGSMERKERSENILDNSPEVKTDIGQDEEPQKRILLSTIILIVVLALCAVGFSYGMYHVLH